MACRARTGLLLGVNPARTRAQTAAVLAEITARDLAPRALPQSFGENVLRDARDLAPAALRLGPRPGGTSVEPGRHERRTRAATARQPAGGPPQPRAAAR
ncbi:MULTISPECIES: hypothetical protein [Catenuloplanes]|uniref:Uncharacterized protein n=1 Tax=Catenuloplanes niger TaxID=587534 RepID=A0AAE4CW10_9ACTN|nr:hypothetical protein [Catenuloplanes niger]MDR7325033.1 hypothetical protein [Catenuloplanes niger]